MSGLSQQRKARAIAASSAAALAYFVLAPCAQALSFGLGAGAGRASKKAADHAAAVYQQGNCHPSTGMSGPVTLVSAPIILNPALGQSITSLGNLNPPGHTLPTDHIYFYYMNLNNPSLTPYTNVYPVYAPADGYLSWVLAALEQGSMQYKIIITHTDTFSTYMDHLMSLEPSILSQISSAPGACTWVRVLGGQQIGTAGGVQGENAVDLGVTNLAVTQPFVNPVRNSAILHSDAPLKYYQGALQASLYNLVQRTTPDYLGSNEKDGIFCFDVPGTISGNWAAQGADPNDQGPASWPQQLSFAYNPVYANEMDVTFGGMNGTKPFRPNEGLGPWRVQVGALPPASVTVQTGVYGYQLNYWDPGNGNYSGGTFALLLVQLLDANTLKAELFEGDYSHTAYPSFDSNAVVYTR